MDRIYYDMACEHFNSKDYKEALVLLKKAKESNPNNIELDHLFGNIYLMQEDYENAKLHFAYSAKNNYKPYDCLIHKIDIEKALNKNANIKTDLDKAIMMEPKHHKTIYTRAKDCIDKLQYKEALDLMLQISKEQLTLTYHHFIIKIYLLLNDKDNALYYLAHQLDPYAIETIRLKARIHKEFEEYQEAKKIIEDMLKFKPDMKVLLGDQIVYSYYVKEYENCITNGKDLICRKNGRPFDNITDDSFEVNREYTSLLFYIGSSYMHLEKSNEGNMYFEVYEKKVKVNQWVPEYFVEKAQRLYDNKQKESEELINQALSYYPNNIPVLTMKINILQIKQSNSQTNNKLDDDKELEKYKNLLNELLDKKPRLNSSYFNIESKNNSHFSNYSKINSTLSSDEKDNHLQSNKEITKNEIIGKGGFGEVSLIKWVDKAIHAMKTINNPNKDNFIKEITSLEAAKHPNIVQYKGHYENNIIMEYCKGKDVYSLIKKKNISLPMKFKYKIIRQIAEALKYLHHEKNIIHGDIKNKNILLDEQYNSDSTPNSYPNAKLADFGLSVLARKDTNRLNGYTLQYVSPEVYNQQNATFQSDIYSFGLTIFELITGKTPFLDTNENNLSKDMIEELISKGFHPNFPTYVKETDHKEDLVELMNGCCKRKPQERLTIDQILVKIKIIEQLNN